MNISLACWTMLAKLSRACCLRITFEMTACAQCTRATSVLSRASSSSKAAGVAAPGPAPPEPAAPGAADGELAVGSAAPAGEYAIGPEKFCW